MPYAPPATPVLCELAQPKCTWIFHKSHFVWKFAGKMPNAQDTTSTKHRAQTLTVRTPSVWPHCLGKNPLADKFENGNPSTFETSQENNARIMYFQKPKQYLYTFKKKKTYI